MRMQQLKHRLRRFLFSIPFVLASDLHGPPIDRHGELIQAFATLNPGQIRVNTRVAQSVIFGQTIQKNGVG